MAAVRDVYMNAVQQRIFYTGARDTRVLAARRFGKTDGTIGPYIWKVAESMPGGGGIWGGSSRKQLLTRTVPGTISAIERFYGMKEGTHFWWGQPPKSLNIPDPIIKPKDWSNVITFCNGFVYHLVSLAVTGSANSLTVNNVVMDECKFLSKAKIDGEVMPALSGITHPFGDWRFSEQNPLYKSTLFCSDASLNSKGNWLEKEEAKLDMPVEHGPLAGRTYRSIQDELEHYASRLMFYNELLRSGSKDGHRVHVVSDVEKVLVQSLVTAIAERKGNFASLPNWGKKPSKAICDFCVNHGFLDADMAELVYDNEFLITKTEHIELLKLQKSKKYADYINQLRCNCFQFVRASSIDNINILGEDYIYRMKRDLPPVVFAISILNLKKAHTGDGFYANLNIEDVHGYVPDDCPAVEKNMRLKRASTVHAGTEVVTDYETPDFESLEQMKNCLLDGDCRGDLPLYIAMDYNANINWVVTGQLYKRDGVDAVNVLSSMYVKNGRVIEDLMADWNRYYTPHKAKNRTVYYFYDTTAKFRNYAVSNFEDVKDTVMKELRKYGWEVIGIDMGQPMKHHEKYKAINESLAGVAYPAIRINTENNEALITAMENTGVQNGFNGFHKDKSGEKLAESEEDLLEYRTDGTDAFDSLYVGIRYFRNRMSGICMMGTRR